MFKKIIILIFLTVLFSFSGSSSGFDRGLTEERKFNSWTQNDYDKYIKSIDMLIDTCPKNEREKYLEVKEIMINIYRLGREYQIQRCPDVRQKKRHEEKVIT